MVDALWGWVSPTKPAVDPVEDPRMELVSYSQLKSFLKVKPEKEFDDYYDKPTTRS